MKSKIALALFGHGFATPSARHDTDRSYRHRPGLASITGITHGGGGSSSIGTQGALEIDGINATAIVTDVTYAGAKPDIVTNPDAIFFDTPATA